MIQKPLVGARSSSRVTHPFTTEALAIMGRPMLAGMIEQPRYLMEPHMAQGEKLLPANT